MIKIFKLCLLIFVDKIYSQLDSIQKHRSKELIAGDINTNEDEVIFLEFV